MDILRDRVITSCWTRADTLKVHFDDPTTTQPKVNIDFPVMSEKLFIWDSMPLRDLEGDIVSVKMVGRLFLLSRQ